MYISRIIATYKNNKQTDKNTKLYIFLYKNRNHNSEQKTISTTSAMMGMSMTKFLTEPQHQQRYGL